MVVPTTLNIRVYLEDTDAGGVVYHASYVRFLERVRTEWLRSAGIQQSDTYDNAYGFVMHKLDLTFHHPAKLDALVTATCRVDRATSARIVFAQQVVDANVGTLLCSAQAQIACIDMRSGRARRLPAALLKNAIEQQASSADKRAHKT